MHFSSSGIEDFSASDLKEYLKSEHVTEFNDDKFLASGFTGTNVNARKILDASRNEVWEVTVIVGDEDGTYLRDSVILRRYEREARRLLDAADRLQRGQIRV